MTNRGVAAAPQDPAPDPEGSPHGGPYGEVPPDSAPGSGRDLISTRNPAVLGMSSARQVGLARAFACLWSRWARAWRGVIVNAGSSHALVPRSEIGHITVEPGSTRRFRGDVRRKGRLMVHKASVRKRLGPYVTGVRRTWAS